MIRVNNFLGLLDTNKIWHANVSQILEKIYVKIWIKKKLN